MQGTLITDLSFLGAYLDPHVLLNSITANIICPVVSSEHFNYQDPGLIWLLHSLDEVFTILSCFYSQVRSKIALWARNRGGWIMGRVRCFLSWTPKAECIKRSVLCEHSKPCTLPGEAISQLECQNQASDKDGLWEKKPQQIWVTGSECRALFTSVCVYVWVWVSWVTVWVCAQVGGILFKFTGWMMPFGCCYMCSSEHIAPAQWVQWVLGPRLLPCTCLKSSQASCNTSLAHIPACTACFKKWKIFSLKI